MNTTTFLQNLTDQTTAILMETKSDFYVTSQHDLNKKRNENCWSALECFEHLNRYNHYYLKAIEDAIKKNQAPLNDEAIKSTWIGRKSIAMMHPSNRKKQKTFKRMNPVNSNLTTDVLDRFIRDQQRILHLVAQASKSNVNANAVPVEFFKMLKMTIAEALEFVIVHQQRHLIQAHEASKEEMVGKQ